MGIVKEVTNQDKAYALASLKGIEYIKQLHTSYSIWNYQSRSLVPNLELQRKKDEVNLKSWLSIPVTVFKQQSSHAHSEEIPKFWFGEWLAASHDL